MEKSFVVGGASCVAYVRPLASSSQHQHGRSVILPCPIHYLPLSATTNGPPSTPDRFLAPKQQARPGCTFTFSFHLLRQDVVAWTTSRDCRRGEERERSKKLCKQWKPCTCSRCLCRRDSRFDIKRTTDRCEKKNMHCHDRERETKPTPVEQMKVHGAFCLTVGRGIPPTTF